MAKKGNCAICDIIEKGSEFTLFDNENCMAVLADKPTGDGHVQLFTKNHFTILEQVPDKLVGEMFTIANKLSTATFEALGMQGTNIIVTNGVAAGQKHAHCLVNIIPRSENDGLSLDWTPKQLTEEEMSTVELNVKEQIEKIGEEDESEVEKTEEKKSEEKKGDENKKKDPNYLLKSIERIP